MDGDIMLEDTVVEVTVVEGEPVVEITAVEGES
jgi:hypothetical protein